MVDISIIVPVYNVQDYLLECVNSLINQSKKDIEIILVDDGSTDNCFQICEELKKKDSRINVIHKCNNGLGMARNSGLEIAKGKFIGFVDSDDFVDRFMFEKLYSTALTNDADIVYCGYWRYINEQQKYEVKLSNKIETWIGKKQINEFIKDLLAPDPQINDDSKYGASVCKGIFRRSIIESNNLKFESEREIISEDIIWDIDYISKAKSIVLLPDCYYFYRYNNNSLTTVYKERFYTNKKLYYCIIDRLKSNEINDPKLYKNLPRYFLTTTRIAIMQEVKFSKINGKHFSVKNIKTILEDDLVIDILNYYEYKKMNLKNYVFFEMMKRRMSLSIFYSVKFILNRKDG